MSNIATMDNKKHLRIMKYGRSASKEGEQLKLFDDSESKNPLLWMMSEQSPDRAEVLTFLLNQIEEESSKEVRAGALWFIKEIIAYNAGSLVRSYFDKNLHNAIRNIASPIHFAKREA